MTGKWTGMLIIAAMVIAITGCGEKAKTPEETVKPSQSPAASETMKSGETNPFAEKYEISYIATSFNTGVVEGDWNTKQLEEKLNITIKPLKIDRANKEQVELMYASGETPDFGWQGPASQSPAGLLEQGIIRTIPRELIEKYAPSYAALLNKNEQGWKLYAHNGNPDEQLAISAYNGDLLVDTFSFYRLDWLEAVGIQPKGELQAIDPEGRMMYTDVAFTKAEFLKIIEAFTNDDPDRNGKKDTYGMSSWNEALEWTWGQLTGYDGFNLMYNLEQDGKTVEWYVSDKYKAFLKEAQSIYRNGYMDKEFATTDWNLWNEKIAGGKVGTWITSSDYVGAAYAIGRAPQLLLNTDPNARILLTPAASRSLTYLSPFTGNMGMVRNDVSDEKLVRILQWIEYMYFDEEAQVYTMYGQEGVQYNWEGEPRKSAILPIENAPAFTNYNGNFMATEETLIWRLNPIARKAKSFAKNDTNVSGRIDPHRYDFLNETNYNAVRGDINATLRTIYSEFHYNVIGGKLDVDKEWDGYLKKLDDAGQQRIFDEVNKMPLTSDYLKS